MRLKISTQMKSSQAPKGNFLHKNTSYDV